MNPRVEWLPVHADGRIWRAIINGNEYVVVADGLEVPHGYASIVNLPAESLQSVARLALEAEGVLC